jgi:hypothetical protein
VAGIRTGAAVGVHWISQPSKQQTATLYQTLTCEHLHKFAAYCAEEGDASLAGNGTRQVRLACAGRPLENDALKAQSNGTVNARSNSGQTWVKLQEFGHGLAL